MSTMFDYMYMTENKSYGTVHQMQGRIRCYKYESEFGDYNEVIVYISY